MIAITASARNNTSGTSRYAITVTRNNQYVASSGIAQNTGFNTEVKIATQIRPDAVIFEVGDTINFVTAGASGALDDVRVVAWFERIE